MGVCDRWSNNRHRQYAGRRRRAKSPPSKTKIKQYMTGHNGPLILRRKPKNQSLNTVLIPLTKSKMPATEPKDLPALSLPIARQVAKIGDQHYMGNYSGNNNKGIFISSGVNPPWWPLKCIPNFPSSYHQTVSCW